MPVTFRTMTVDEAMAIDLNVIHHNRVRIDKNRGRTLYAFKRRAPNLVTVRWGKLVDASVAYLNGEVLNVTYRMERSV